MQTLNLAEVRDRFSQLVDDVHTTGEGVIVAKYGHPFVMLVPYSAPSEDEPSAHPLRGLPYRMADDFDDPMPELTLCVAESGPDFGVSGGDKARR